MDWSLEECLVTGLLLLFFTHFYIPILEPVQNSLFAAASDDQTIVGQLVGMGVWTVAGSLMLPRCRELLSGARSILFTSSFTLLALISAFWSQDANITVRKAVFLLLTTAFGIYFAKHFSVERQLRMICVSAAIITVLSVFFALLVPRYGLDHDVHEGVWVGVFTQKNVCAREMLFILICLLSYKPLTRGLVWIRSLALVCTFAVIVGTQSKTALLMTALVLFFFLGVQVLRRMSTGLVFTSGAVFLSVVGGGLIIAASAVPRLASILGRDSTMTGRTEIWHSVLEAIMKRPLLGYGFAAFWLSLRGESANIILTLRWAVPAAHNGFLEIWLQLGIAGVVLFGLGFLQAALPAVRRFRDGAAQIWIWPLGVLLLTIVYNLDESSIMQANDFLWVLYVATVVNVSSNKTRRYTPVEQMNERSLPTLVPAV